MGSMLTGLPQVRDGKPTTPPQHPNRFVQSLSPAGVCRNVVVGQATDDHVDALVAKRQCGHVGGVHLDAIGDVFQCRIGQRCRLRVFGLIGTPWIDAYRTAGRQPLGRGEQHRAAPTSEVDQRFIAAQSQAVENPFPGTELARSRSVE